MKLFRITTIPLSLDKLLTGQLKYMSQNGFEVVAVSAEGVEIESIKKRENCRYEVIPLTRTISPFADLIALRKLVSLIKKEQPVIVHTHMPKAGFIGMLASKICNVPLRLHTVAGLPLMETSGVKKKILVWVEKLTYACATNVYPNSFELKKYIQENKFVSPDKLKVLGKGSSNGIDTNYFQRTSAVEERASQIREEKSIASTDLVFVFVGRIVKDKGINELVKAFQKLNDKYSAVKLLLIGPFEDDLDPIDQQTKDIIQQNKNIISTGFINDIRPYLAASDVLVFPSYREGFPNVPLQAGCFDLPLILSNINGCNEIVKDGLNGLLVPPKDENALEDAMEKMITDPELRRKCAFASKQMIIENYSRENIWQELLNEYKRLLHKKGIPTEHVQKSYQTFS